MQWHGGQHKCWSQETCVNSILRINQVLSSKVKHVGPSTWRREALVQSTMPMARAITIRASSSMSIFWPENPRTSAPFFIVWCLGPLGPDLPAQGFNLSTPKDEREGDFYWERMGGRWPRKEQREEGLRCLQRHQPRNLSQTSSRIAPIICLEIACLTIWTQWAFSEQQQTCQVVVFVAGDMVFMGLTFQTSSVHPKALHIC